MMTVTEALMNYLKKLDQELAALESQGGDGEAREKQLEAAREYRNAAELLVNALEQTKKIL